MKAMAIKILLKFVDVKGLLKALLSEILFDELIYKKLDELVLESTNTLDDGLSAILKPQLKSAVLAYSDQKIDELMVSISPSEIKNVTP